MFYQQNQDVTSVMFTLTTTLGEAENELNFCKKLKSFWRLQVMGPLFMLIAELHSSVMIH